MTTLKSRALISALTALVILVAALGQTSAQGPVDSTTDEPALPREQVPAPNAPDDPALPGDQLPVLNAPEGPALPRDQLPVVNTPDGPAVPRDRLPVLNVASRNFVNNRFSTLLSIIIKNNKHWRSMIVRDEFVYNLYA